MSETLTDKQIQLCRSNPRLMPYVVRASLDVLRTCQDLFATSRWNCSSLNLAPNFTPELKDGTREHALVRSLASSALVVNVARACSSGHIRECRCSNIDTNHPGKAFRWRGCDGSINHAVSFARSFTSTKSEPGRANESEVLITRVDYHNDAVGRMVARDNLRTVCRCHGASGSCAFKTCWKTAEDVEVIGGHLMEKYFGSVRVNVHRRKNGKWKLVPAKEELNRTKAIRLTDLVFRSISSDYCLPDAGLGSVGTRGRLCHANDTAAGKCNTLCCGRGFKSEEKVMKVKCHCKYHWCCYVKCDTCQQMRRLHWCR